MLTIRIWERITWIRFKWIIINDLLIIIKIKLIYEYIWIHNPLLNSKHHSFTASYAAYLTTLFL